MDLKRQSEHSGLRADTSSLVEIYITASKAIQISIKIFSSLLVYIHASIDSTKTDQTFGSFSGSLSFFIKIKERETQLTT